jgi:hypothetical protein
MNDSPDGECWYDGLQPPTRYFRPRSGHPALIPVNRYAAGPQRAS